MIKTTILVPVADNAGVLFTHQDWEWVLTEALQRFGGITYEGTAQGRWVDEGVTYIDDTPRRASIRRSWSSSRKCR